MNRATPLARLERVQQIQSRVSAAVGARNGAVLAAIDGDGEGQTTAELWLYGVVGGYWWGFNDKTVADQLRGLNVDHITVRLNSPGGDAIQGVAIGNLLRNHKAQVTVVVDGIAASAASIIAIAGDEVVMSPGSQMMIHDPWMFTLGNAKELRQDADFLDKQGSNMASVYAHETGATAEAMREVMTAEPDGTWYTADEAVAANLATRVGTVVAVSAAPEPPPVDLDDDGEDGAAARAAWDLEVLITPAARAAWTGLSPKPPSASAVGSITTHEGSSDVAFTTEQLTTMRQDLGLSETADEATIVAALSEALAERAETGPSTPTVPDGMALIDTATLDTLRSAAEQGRQAREQQMADRRESLVSAAIQDGRIAPARRDDWLTMLAADPGSEQTLASLAPGLVPVAEMGHAGDADTSSEDAIFAALFGETMGA